MDKKERLAFLNKRNEELKPIVFVGFKTKEELFAYRETIKKERDEYYTNLKEIDQLEWDLKTPEEQLHEKFNNFRSKLIAFSKWFDFVGDLDNEGLWKTDYLKTEEKKLGVWLQKYRINKKSKAVNKWYAFYEEMKDKYLTYDEDGNLVVKKNKI